MRIKRNPPVADQVVDLLTERIRQRYYEPGERLPSEPELAQLLGVSRSSVRAALSTLESQAMVTRKHGDGTYVLRQAPGDHVFVSGFWGFSTLIAGTGKPCSVETLRRERRLATDDEVKALQMAGPGPVYAADRVYLAGEDRAILASHILAVSIYLVPPEETDTSLYLDDYLLKYCNQEIFYTKTLIGAENATPSVAEALHVQTGAAMLRLSEVFYSSPDECPIALSESWINPASIWLESMRHWRYQRD